MGLAISNIFLALNLRFPEESAFGRATLSNSRLLFAFAWAVLGTMLITQIPFLQQMFDTTPLTLNQWGLCLVPGVILLMLGEIFKIILRARRPHEEATAAVVATPEAA